MTYCVEHSFVNYFKRAAGGEYASNPLVDRLKVTRDSSLMVATTALGALGEEHVVDVCRAELGAAGRQDLANRVERVSKRSDQLGWDVDAPTLGPRRRKLEVKTTRASGPLLKCFLSRNEARIGGQDPEWSLVVCRVDENDQIEVVGWCAMRELTSLLPDDRHPQGRWQSVALTIHKEVLRPGLPPIREPYGRTPPTAVTSGRLMS